MPKTVLILSLMIVALCAPALAQAGSFPGTFDKTYSGQVTFEVFPATGGAALQSETGSGEATFARQKDGTIRLKAQAASPENGGLSFEFDLKQAGKDGWRAFTPEGMTELTPQGRLLSISQSPAGLTTLHGDLGRDTLTLFVRNTSAGTASDPGYEMVFTFNLTLETAAPVKRPAGRAKGKTGSKCAQTVMQPRHIANPGGDTMSMIMVPVCVPG